MINKALKDPVLKLVETNYKLVNKCIHTHIHTYIISGADNAMRKIKLSNMVEWLRGWGGGAYSYRISDVRLPSEVTFKLTSK